MSKIASLKEAEIRNGGCQGLGRGGNVKLLFNGYKYQLCKILVIFWYILDCTQMSGFLIHLLKLIYAGVLSFHSMNRKLNE